ncbi:Cro/CI family transcriptional regulator [Stutzerimonas nitrititolerans]|uniref:Cro/CI family transcriptional regulator n=1 Tax=Stutzerimonas nitrititolerans TaxID=2482751 RepID=UPI0028AD2728|nr:Cro/CI family transcriptional regulator [Stutzerimonas nitrititolerans]
MRRIPLKEFAQAQGQTQAAKALGLTQGALNKALRVGREIYVIAHTDGTYTAEELRPFPSQQPKSQAA